MIKAKVLFFGATAESSGTRCAEIEVGEGETAAAALDRIFEKFPDLAKRHNRKFLHFSVNQEYASGDEKIEEGDELAVFTAVSGG